MQIQQDKQTILYITKIPRDCQRRDLEKLFKKFGVLIDVMVKDRYAFIAYSSPSEANKAMVEMDGFLYEGHRLIVEKAGLHLQDVRGFGPQQKDKCFNCGKYGHWANECREKKSKSKKGSHKNNNHNGNSYTSKFIKGSNNEFNTSFQRRNRNQQFKNKAYSKQKQYLKSNRSTKYRQARQDRQDRQDRSHSKYRRSPSSGRRTSVSNSRYRNRRHSHSRERYSRERSYSRSRSRSRY